MNKNNQTYLYIILLFAFVIPQLLSDMHYIEYHDFSLKKTDSKDCFTTYKHHHICENQILKLHSFITFDLPFTAAIPDTLFKDLIFKYSKIILIKGLFIHRNKRGPPFSVISHVLNVK